MIIIISQKIRITSPRQPLASVSFLGHLLEASDQLIIAKTHTAIRGTHLSFIIVIETGAGETQAFSTVQLGNLLAHCHYPSAPDGAEHLAGTQHLVE